MSSTGHGPRQPPLPCQRGMFCQSNFSLWVAVWVAKQMKSAQNWPKCNRGDFRYLLGHYWPSRSRKDRRSPSAILRIASAHSTQGEQYLLARNLRASKVSQPKIRVPTHRRAFQNTPPNKWHNLIILSGMLLVAGASITPTPACSHECG